MSSGAPPRDRSGCELPLVFLYFKVPRATGPGKTHAVALRVGTSRLDALRVRAAALRHERESLTEHMELLEEHLARLKADLEYKQSEVSEVAHQWEAAKAKLPALRQRQAGSEQMRANLQQIVAVLKAHLLKHNKNKLPKQPLHVKLTFDNNDRNLQIDVNLSLAIHWA